MIHNGDYISHRICKYDLHLLSLVDIDKDNVNFINRNNYSLFFIARKIEIISILAFCY